jgi:pimeloyl-ACP methyl ester carboxylesterase
MIEQAVRFGASGALVGIVTRPEVVTEAPAFVMLNAGVLHRIGPHRLHVELARALATIGLASIRFDFSGIGDSGPRTDPLPARQAAVEETREAMEVLESAVGCRRFVVAGLCSGADVALRTAVRDPRVVGAVLIDGLPYRSWQFFVRHYTRRLFRLSSWRNVLSGRHRGWSLLQARRNAPARRAPPSGTGQWWPLPTDRDIPTRTEAQDVLRALVARQVRLYLVYTGGYGEFVNAARQVGEVFPGVDAPGYLAVEHLPDADHVFTLGRHRERLVALVQSWCASSGWLEAARPGPGDPARVPVREGVDA